MIYFHQYVTNTFLFNIHIIKDFWWYSNRVVSYIQWCHMWINKSIVNIRNDWKWLKISFHSPFHPLTHANMLTLFHIQQFLKCGIEILNRKIQWFFSFPKISYYVSYWKIQTHLYWNSIIHTFAYLLILGCENNSI